METTTLKSEKYKLIEKRDPETLTPETSYKIKSIQNFIESKIKSIRFISRNQ